MGGKNIVGIVTSGLGKGAVFVSIDYYKTMIKKKLGFEPYPGTLNLIVDKNHSDLLKDIIPIRIRGFKKDDKIFGGVSCYKIRINGINAALIVPDLTEHEENNIEIVAQVNLKSELKIKDGNKVTVELQ